MPAIISSCRCTLAATTLLLGGCSGSSPDASKPPSDPDWSDRQEEIYQLREVIRYEDAQASVRREALRALSLSFDPTTSTETGMATGKGEDQDQQ